MADTTDILGVGRVTQCPVIHLDLGTIFLGFPDCVHQHVDGALGGRFSVTVQYWNPHDNAESVLSGRLVLLQDRAFAIELGLAV